MLSLNNILKIVIIYNNLNEIVRYGIITDLSEGGYNVHWSQKEESYPARQTKDWIDSLPVLDTILNEA